MITNSSDRTAQLQTAGPILSKEEYRQHIQAFIELLEPNSIAIIPTHKERIRTRDLPFPFRPHSNILWLNGFPEPESVIVLTNIGRPELIMFVRPRDKEEEQWTGFRAGKQGAKLNYLANAAHHIDDFESVLAKLMRKADHIYYRFGTNRTIDKKFNAVWLKEQKTLFNPDNILNELRMIKSPTEIEMMRHSNEIAAAAHCQALKRLHPGMMEYQLQSVIEQIFTEHGAMSPAYPSIVGSGPNACILHYIENQARIADGHLVLIDAGAEYLGYASDITSTFPANGKFSTPQRQIYSLVLAAHNAAIAACRPGVTMRQLQAVADRVLRAGLVELQILPEEMSTIKGEKQAVARANAEGKEPPLTLVKFFPHRLGHWIGIDTHDVGRPPRSAVPPSESKRYARFLYGYERPMEKHMCLTDEPGLYFMPDKRVDKMWWHIGVRIERDLVVTSDGCEVLGDWIPKDPDDIELAMAKPARKPGA